MKEIQPALDEAFEQKTKAFIIKLLKLGEDIDLKVDIDLVQQIGLDSIEAFDAVATMHELIGVAIPDDFNPRVVSTIRGLSRYVLDHYEKTAIDRFLALDLNTVATIRKDEDDL